MSNHFACNEELGRAISDQVMSGQLPQFFGSIVPKKAMHVKWAGKSIALGTFPIEEGREKCARAKALTKAWRLTMVPKPSREWVIKELERHKVRVVVTGGRGGPQGKEDEEQSDEGDSESETEYTHVHPPSKKPRTDDNEEDATASLLRLANSANDAGSRSNSLVRAQGPPASDDFRSETSTERQPSSLASTLLQAESTSNGSAARNVSGLGEMPAASAAGVISSAESPGSAGLSLVDNQIGSTGDDYAFQMGNPSVDPNHHYEMLKLHHMNLLQELEETTVMMNLHQQQLLDQQQQSMQQLQQFYDPSSSGAFNMGSTLTSGLEPSLSSGEISAMGAQVSRFNERYFGGNPQIQSLLQTGGNSIGTTKADDSAEKLQQSTQGGCHGQEAKEKEQFKTESSRRSESDEIRRLKEEVAEKQRQLDAMQLKEELAEKKRQLDALLRQSAGGTNERRGDPTLETNQPTAKRTQNGRFASL